MKINPKILSIPPYISTSWKNIASLHVESQSDMLVLVVTLLSGVRIEVPHLESSTIEAIFAAHTQYIEQEEKPAAKLPPRAPLGYPLGQEEAMSVGLQLKNSLSNMEQMGTMLQHNPEQADSPDLPSDILHKIAHLSKTLGIEDPNSMPKPEPHCNCMFCQVAKAMQSGLHDESEEQQEDLEEIVSDEELKFKTWDIKQTGEQLYTVTNPLESKECYSVYLGQPIGCTCGENHCDHIKAVLST